MGNCAGCLGADKEGDVNIRVHTLFNCSRKDPYSQEKIFHS